MLRNGYSTVQRETLTGRALEREVFSRITSRLASADNAQPGGQAQLAEALDENRRLWRTLAVDLALPSNALTQELRASLISLAEFVDRHTHAVLRGEGSKDVLIEINQNIVGGLSALSEAAA